MSNRADTQGAVLRVCLLPPADLTSESGSTLYSKAVAARLVELGHEVTVVCSVPDPALPVKYIEAPIALPHPYDDNQGTPSAVFYDCIDVTFRAMLPHLEKNAWDVVHAVYPSFNGFTAALASCLFPVPSVVSCLGRIVNVAAYLDRRYRALAASTFTNSEFVVAANQGIKRTIVEEYGYPAEKIEVLPMAVDLRDFAGAAGESRAATASRDDKTVELLSVCSCLTEEKGVPDVLQALGILRERAPGLRWRYTVIGPDPVAGEPYLRRLVEHSRDLGLEERVRLQGFVPHSQIARHLKSSGILVDARRVGNFSSVILEALATGTAVIGSDVEGNTEFLRHGENGLLFKTGDPESLAERLQLLMTSPEHLERLRVAAAEWFRVAGERYQFPAHVRVLEQVYRAALLSRSSSRVSA